MAIALQIDPTIANARQHCADLLRQATGPMHVAQPNGSTLRLCYLGRIMRAQTMIDTVAPDLKPAVIARYEEIVAEANAKWAIYQAARTAYLNACAWAGVEPDEPQERECNCSWCSAHEPPPVHGGDALSVDPGDVDPSQSSELAGGGTK